MTDIEIRRGNATKPSFFTFNPAGFMCRCRCDDNHPGQTVCEWYVDEDVCVPCGRLLVADVEMVIRDLVGVLDGTRTNANELMVGL